MPSEESAVGVVRTDITTVDHGECWLFKCERDAQTWVYNGDEFAAKVCEQCHDQLTDTAKWEDGNEVV
ncbi:hypothetical protein [Halorubrum salinum]|uniref:hypothetical protein n=1 Tax=Halorubrum salinum TaxID=767517 RepID=UPI002112048B|nr:hypothetical protein [Halorubrum salinum]